MYCPEHLVFKAFGGRVYLWMIWRDVPRHTIPLKIWLDIRHYELKVITAKYTIIADRRGIRKVKPIHAESFAAMKGVGNEQ